MWRRVTVVVTTPQLHWTKPELRFCAGSNPTRGVSEIRGGEDLWQWSLLEIKLNAFRRSTMPQPPPPPINSSSQVLIYKDFSLERLLAVKRLLIPCISNNLYHQAGYSVLTALSSCFIRHSTNWFRDVCYMHVFKGKSTVFTF